MSQQSHADESTRTGDSWEPKFVPIGARVGRSGQVFETDGRVGVDAVVKLFTWGAGLPQEVIQQFTREAMTVADLRHPHIAAVLDAGTLGDGTPFVVMERLPGVTLEEAASARSLPIGEVLLVLRGIGSALGAAHAAGIAHGELRADNVFLADVASAGPGGAKLLDFGVARLAAGLRAIGGTGDRPALHAVARPGVELGSRAGERADQLALAGLAWRLLGAQSPPAIQRVLVRAMSLDPSQRFGSIAAFVGALEQASADAASARWPTNAAAVTALFRGMIPVARSRPAVVTPPSRPVPARPGIVAPIRASATPPSSPTAPPSLTQQFFAAGEQLEMAHAAGQAPNARAAAEEEAEEDAENEPAAAPRLPRSRTQVTTVALLAVGSVSFIVWTLISLAGKPADSPPGADASPASAVARPPDVSPAGVRGANGPTDRGPRKTAPAAGRAARVPPPFAAAPSKPPVTATAPPPAAPAPAPIGAAPATADQAPPLPAAAPTGSADDDDTPAESQAAGEPDEATPSPTTSDEAIRAPRAWDGPPPPAPAPQAPAPSEAAPPTAP